MNARPGSEAHPFGTATPRYTPRRARPRGCAGTGRFLA